MNSIYIYGPKEYSPQSIPSHILNTTSRSVTYGRAFSPFLLGPIELYNDLISQNMENGWQYAKVYPEFVDSIGTPTVSYWDWALSGWNMKRANRYPMGKNKHPLCSLWDGKRLGYIEARKQIYIPLYSQCVRRIPEYEKLLNIFKSQDIHLWDFDGYSTQESMQSIIENPNRKMGHAFVLAQCLYQDALERTEMTLGEEVVLSHR